MEYRKLGQSDLTISALGMGTMTFGEQNDSATSHALLDAALDSGINFFDTAEMYPVPANEKTYTETEHILGQWIGQRGNRNKIILTTKIAGPAGWANYIRGGETRFDYTTLSAVLNESLMRLKTDYVDLYQLHWPDRPANYFGTLGYKPAQADKGDHIAETLDALERLITEGKVRYIGVSNETPWGLMKFLRLAGQSGKPRVISIQNPFNLLNRSFEVGLAEVAHREKVGLIAYSPLAFGTLSGKYLGDQLPEGSRLHYFKKYKRYTRYSNDRAATAVSDYVKCARDAALDPAQMAIAYVLSKPYLSSALIGATTLVQLRSNLASIDVKLDKATIKTIDAIHANNPNPCP